MVAGGRHRIKSGKIVFPISALGGAKEMKALMKGISIGDGTSIERAIDFSIFARLIIEAAQQSSSFLFCLSFSWSCPCWPWSCCGLWCPPCWWEWPLAGEFLEWWLLWKSSLVEQAKLTIVFNENTISRKNPLRYIVRCRFTNANLETGTLKSFIEFGERVT